MRDAKTKWFHFKMGEIWVQICYELVGYDAVQFGNKVPMFRGGRGGIYCLNLHPLSGKRQYSPQKCWHPRLPLFCNIGLQSVTDASDSLSVQTSIVKQSSSTA